jgi:predicted metal-binding membrane protein
VSTLGAHRGLLGASAVVFVASAITTVLWCGSMCSMPGMPWMRMPGQSWPGAAATFIGMWSVMMVAMMLPAFLPMLMRYRATVADSGASLSRLTGLVAAATSSFGLWWVSSSIHSVSHWPPRRCGVQCWRKVFRAPWACSLLLQA